MRSPTLFHCHASMSPTEVKATLIPPLGKAIKFKSADALVQPVPRSTMIYCV
jgi:hypothetical protein